MPKAKVNVITNLSLCDFDVNALAKEADFLISEMNRLDRASMGSDCVKSAALHRIHDHLSDRLATALNCASFAKVRTKSEAGILAMIVAGNLDTCTESAGDFRLVRRCVEGILDAFPDLDRYPHLMSFLCGQRSDRAKRTAAGK